MSVVGDRERRRWLLAWIREALNAAYWRRCDAKDAVAEAIAIPSHYGLRVALYRHLLGVAIGPDSSRTSRLALLLSKGRAYWRLFGDQPRSLPRRAHGLADR